MKNRSIRTILSTYFIILATAIFLGVSVIYMFLQYRTLRRQAEESLAAVYSIRVKVVIPKISRKRINMLVGARFNLKMKHTKLTPVWSSTNTRVATVDSRGRVTALAAGTAVIKATIENVDYTCTVTVKNGNKL